jgi:hypothetical protein
MSDPPRRPSAQLRLAVVLEVLEAMRARLHARWRRRRHGGHLELAEEQLDVLAREVQLEAHDAVADAHERGRRLGRDQVRAELGLPPEVDAGPDDDTRRLAPCPLNGQACAVPARRKDPP